MKLLIIENGRKTFNGKIRFFSYLNYSIVIDGEKITLQEEHQIWKNGKLRKNTEKSKLKKPRKSRLF